MPVIATQYTIKQLDQINQIDNLYDKIIEVETSTGQDENFKVSIPTLFQAFTNSAPGANDTKSGYKLVRCYSPQTPQYTPGNATLMELNPDFLCLGTICKCEFPNQYYILVYDSRPTAIQVWLDGRFNTVRIGAQWVVKDSIEDVSKDFADFDPFKASYLEKEAVRYTVDGVLRLFVARRDLVKSTFAGNEIPAPTGLLSDQNWREINPVGLPQVGDYIPNQAYKRNHIVVFSKTIYRAKRNISAGISIISAGGGLDEDLLGPPAADWEAIGGAGAQYDDSLVQERLLAVEGGLTALAKLVDDNKVALDARIDDLVTLIPDWVSGSYRKDQVVLSSGRIFRARQNMNTSSVAPTTLTAYWEPVGGGAGGGGPVLDNDVTIELNGITESIGGVTPGNFSGNLEQLLTRLLIKYQAPSFSYFNLAGGGSRTLEAGSTVTAPFVFTWGTNNSTNVAANQLAIRDVSANQLLVGGSTNDGAETITGSSYVLGLGQSKVYEISSRNSNNEPFSANLTLSTALRRYWGALSATPAQLKAQLAGAAATTVGFTGSDLTTSISLNQNYDASGGKYIYYLYPASLGNPTVIFSGPDAFSAYTIEDLTITDVFGISRAYKLFSTLYQTGQGVNVNIVS